MSSWRQERRETSAFDWRYQTLVKKCDVFPLVLLRLFSGLEILVYHRSLYHKGINFVLINQNIFYHNIELWVITWCTWSPSDINECSQINIRDEHASCSNIEGSYLATVAPVILNTLWVVLIHALNIFKDGTCWTRCK